MNKSALALAAMLSTVVILNGCETGGSADSTIRQVSANFTGVYENDGAPLASSQSGAEVTVLVLNQTGDRLEAFDNFDNIWKGTLAEVFVTDEGGGARAPFTLEGRTTAGQQVTISGTLFAENNSDSAGANAVMTGTWVEDTLFASFYAEGTVASIVIPDNNNGNGTNDTGTISISASRTTLPFDNDSATLTVSGGSAPYTWESQSTVDGTVNPTTGTSVTYTRASSGDNVVRVTDSNGNTDSITMSQP